MSAETGFVVGNFLFPYPSPLFCTVQASFHLVTPHPFLSPLSSSSVNLLLYLLRPSDEKGSYHLVWIFIDENTTSSHYLPLYRLTEGLIRPFLICMLFNLEHPPVLFACRFKIPGPSSLPFFPKPPRLPPPSLWITLSAFFFDFLRLGN